MDAEFVLTLATKSLYHTQIQYIYMLLLLNVCPFLLAYEKQFKILL